MGYRIKDNGPHAGPGGVCDYRRAALDKVFLRDPKPNLLDGLPIDDELCVPDKIGRIEINIWG